MFYPLALIKRLVDLIFGDRVDKWNNKQVTSPKTDFIITAILVLIAGLVVFIVIKFIVE